MKKYFVGAAASTAALLFGMSSTAIAASVPTPRVPSVADGFVSIAVGGKTVLDTFNSATASGISIEGAASGEHNFSANLGFQGDLVLNSQNYLQTLLFIPTTTDQNVEAALHAFYRNDQFLIGGFGQYGSDYFSLQGGTASLSTDHLYGGVEGQVFFGNATLYGQAGATQFGVPGETFTGSFGSLEARYFLSPDFKIEAHVGVNTFGLNDWGMTTTHFGIGTEYRLAETPISLFAKYDYSRHTFDGDSSSFLSDNRFLVGAKFNFDGTSTLIERDRSGASLKPVANNDMDRYSFGFH